MSFPNVPNIKPEISVDRDDAINLLLVSFAYEELGFAHILNAEGEKIQLALDTLKSQKMPQYTIEDLLKMNRSVNQVLKNIIKKEMLLQFKLENILDLIEGDDDNDEG